MHLLLVANIIHQCAIGFLGCVPIRTVHGRVIETVAHDAPAFAEDFLPLFAVVHIHAHCEAHPPRSCATTCGRSCCGSCTSSCRRATTASSAASGSRRGSSASCRFHIVDHAAFKEVDSASIAPV